MVNTPCWNSAVTLSLSTYCGNSLVREKLPWPRSWRCHIPRLNLSAKELFVQITAANKNKKTDVAEHPKVFDRVGLLRNEPPGVTGVPFI